MNKTKLDDFYFIIIKNPSFFRYKINDRVFLDLESKLQHSPMRQFFVKSELLNFSIPKGVRSHIIDTISIGKFEKKSTLVTAAEKCVFLFHSPHPE